MEDLVWTEDKLKYDFWIFFGLFLEAHQRLDHYICPRQKSVNLTEDEIPGRLQLYPTKLPI